MYIYGAGSSKCEAGGYLGEGRNKMPIMNWFTTEAWSLYIIPLIWEALCLQIEPSELPG